MRRGWLRVKSAAGYADVSVRTIRSWLKEGLQHSRIHGTGAILIKIESLDAFIGQFEVQSKYEQISDEMIQEFK